MLKAPFNPTHPASLCKLNVHDKALVQVLRTKVPAPFFGMSHSTSSSAVLTSTDHVANATSDVISIVDDDALDTPPLTPGSELDAPSSAQNWWERDANPDDSDLPELADFIRGLAAQSNVQMPTLSVTLIYLNRLKSKLPSVATGKHIHRSVTDS